MKTVAPSPRATARHSSAMRTLSAIAVFLSMVAIVRADRVVTAGAAPGEVLQVGDAVKIKTQGTVEIQAGADAYFRSATQIVLQPGFKSAQGSFFHGVITQAFATSLAWEAVAGATSYKIYRNGVYLGETASTSFADNTVQPGGMFTYQIKAVIGGVETTAAVLQAGNPSSLEIFTPLSQ